LLRSTEYRYGIFLHRRPSLVLGGDFTRTYLEGGPPRVGLLFGARGRLFGGSGGPDNELVDGVFVLVVRGRKGAAGSGSSERWENREKAANAGTSLFSVEVVRAS